MTFMAFMAFLQLRGFKKKDTARVEFIQSNRKRK